MRAKKKKSPKKKEEEKKAEKNKPNPGIVSPYHNFV